MGAGKSGGAGAANDYYGSIAGLVSHGPIDFISGIVADDALIWPNAPQWPASSAVVHSKKIQTGVATFYVQTLEAHRLTVGDQVYIWGFGIPVIDGTTANVIAVGDGFSFTCDAPAGSVGILTAYDQGFVSKVVPIVTGDLRRIGANVYRAIANHSASAATAPPNPTYWQQFRVLRTGGGITNPLDLLEDSTGASGAAIIKLTSESHGEIYLYWGTDSQTLDNINERVLWAAGHPPYRGLAVVVLKNFFFGRERATPPNIQVIAGRNPVQSVVTGAAAALDADGQANPLCVLAEVLTNKIWGVGLDAARLDATSWQAAADWALANSALTYQSALIDRATGIRQLIDDLLSAVDLYVYWGADGLLHAGHWPHGSAPPAFTAANTIDYNSVIDGSPIGWKTDLWDGASSKTTIKFADGNHAFAERPAIAANNWTRTSAGVSNDRSLDRPYVTRGNQAAALAAWDATVSGEQDVSGSLVVRPEKIGFGVGDTFLLTHDLLGVSIICRCTGLTYSAPPAQTVTVDFARERGQFGTPYFPTIADPTLEGKPHPSPLRVYSVIQVPAALAGKDYQVALIAGRAGLADSRVDLYLRQADPTVFYQLGSISSFAVAGAVIGSVTGGVSIATLPVFVDGGGHLVDDKDTTQIKFSVDAWIPQADLDHIANAQSADAIADNSLLLWIVDAADPRKYEISTVKALTAITGGYSATIRRARYNTKQGADGATAWAAGAKVYVIHRSELAWFGHDYISRLATSGGTAVFRATANTVWIDGNPTAVYSPGVTNTGDTVETSLTFGDVNAPAVLADNNAPAVLSVAIIVPTAGGVTLGPGPYATTDLFYLQAIYSSTNANLQDVTIATVSGGVETVVWTSNLPATGITGLIQSANFGFAAAGAYTVSITVRDVQGRRRKVQAVDATPAPLVINIGPTGGGTVAAVLISPGTGVYGGSTVAVTMSCATPAPAGGSIVIEYFDFVAWQANPIPNPWQQYSTRDAAGALHGGSGTFNQRSIGSQLIARARTTAADAGLGTGATLATSVQSYANYGY